MKKRTVILIIFGFVLLLIIGAYFYIQTGLQIETTVYDSVEKKPISQATVKIDEKAYFTDNKGYMQARIPLFFKHKVIIEKNGYKVFKTELSLKASQKSYKLVALIDPITFSNILNMAQKELQDAKSFSFRSTWINNQDELDETFTYSLYEISQEGILHFKWLQDDKQGNLLANREMIKTGETLYYRDNSNTNWQKIDEKKIPPVKLQEPADILDLFQGIEEPSNFLYDGLDTLYEDSTGKLFLQNELPSQTIDEQGNEISYKQLKVLRYIASWNVLNGKREILFYVAEESLRLYKGILTDESQETINPEEMGRLKKQTLSFTMSKLNETVQITVPEA